MPRQSVNAPCCVVRAPVDLHRCEPFGFQMLEADRHYATTHGICLTVCVLLFVPLFILMRIPTIYVDCPAVDSNLLAIEITSYLTRVSLTRVSHKYLLSRYSFHHTITSQKTFAPPASVERFDSPVAQ